MATTSGFKVACPSCEAMVPIKDSSLVGKKVDCPKCKYRFVVEGSPDSNDGEGEDKSSKKGAATATKKAAAVGAGKAVGAALDKVNGAAKSKGKPLPRRDDDEESETPTKKKKSNTTLLVGGGIGVLAILLLVVGYFGGWFGGDDKPSNPGTKTVTQVPNKGGRPDPTEPEAPEEKKDEPKQPVSTSVAFSDITNKLPGDTQLVLAIDAKKFLSTPIGSSIFDSATGSEPFFKSRTSFSPREVHRVIVAASLVDGWTFTLIQTRANLKIDTVKAAIDPRATPTTIKKRDYYPIKNNEMLTMLGSYLNDHLEVLKPFGMGFATPPGGRNMTFNLFDAHTLIIADQAPMERFLRDDGKPRELSIMAPQVPVEGDPNSPMGTNPMGGFPMGPRGGQSPMGGGNPGGQTNAVYTSNPSYRTIDPSLKAMLNRLDEKNDSPLLLAFKLPDLGKIGSGVLGIATIQIFGGSKLPAITKSPLMGLCVSKFDQNKFELKAGLEVGKDTEAKEIEKLLTNSVLPLVAAELRDALNIPIEVRGLDPNNPGNTSPTGPSGGTFPPMGVSPGPGGRPTPGPGGRPGPSSAPSEQGSPFQDGRPTPGPGGRPGPMGPMPGFPMPTNPSGGQPSDPNDPNRPKINSFLEATSSDNIVIVTAELDWKVVYNSRVTPPIRSLVESQRGRVTMLAGRAHWYNLGPAVSKMQSQPMIPRGALVRRPDQDRFGMPYAPGQRVSWMVDLLPHLGYDLLYRSVDKEKSWNHEFNLAAGEHWVPEFLNAASPSDSWRSSLPSLRGRELGATHFVGLSGIGLDSGDYPDAEPYSKKLGIFGFERDTKFEDVAKGDGLGNTIFMIQVAPDMQRPWIRGGGSTVQGVPEKGSLKPFVSMQGDKKFGAHVVMADGSVRFISSNIDEEVFKALVTYKGGEKVGDIDTIAPKAQQNELRTQPGPVGDGSTDIVAPWSDFFIPELLGTVRFPFDPERIAVVTNAKEDPNDPNAKQKVVNTGDIHYVWKSGLLQMIVRVDIIRDTLVDNGGERDLDTQLRKLDAEGRKPTDVKKLVVAGGRPARTFETTSADGRFAHQLFFYNRRLVMMEVSVARVTKADTKKFFDSLKIEDPETGKWRNATVSFGGVQVSADFPGKPLVATSMSEASERAWTVNMPNGVRYVVGVRTATDLPEIDTEAKAVDKIIADAKERNPKTELYDTKRVDNSGIEGREFKTKTSKSSSLNRVWVLNGAAVSIRVMEHENAKAEDLKRFLDSLKVSKGDGSAPEPKKDVPKKGL